MTAVRIKKYRLKKSGLRGAVVGLPPSQLETMGVTVGDSLSFYTGVFNGLPVVIIANSDEPILTDEVAGQARELREFMEAAR